jgi:hypothetical protein
LTGIGGWLVVSQTGLLLVLPNIENFYSPGSTSPPVGFMM